MSIRRRSDGSRYRCQSDGSRFQRWSDNLIIFNYFYFRSWGSHHVGLTSIPRFRCQSDGSRFRRFNIKFRMKHFHKNFSNFSINNFKLLVIFNKKNWCKRNHTSIWRFDGSRFRRFKIKFTITNFHKITFQTFQKNNF